MLLKYIRQAFNRLRPVEQTEQDNKLGLDKDYVAQFPEYYRLRRIAPEAFLSIPELVEQTHEFMLKLRNTILQLREGQDNKNAPPITFFFLDKSARPLAFLVRLLWKEYFPEIEWKQIHIRFINIGTDYYNDDISFDPTPLQAPELIKRNYKIPEKGPIIIVDEYSATGKTIHLAERLFEKTFPNRKIQRIVAYSKPPNWYQNSFFLGVEEPNFYYYAQIARQRLTKATDMADNNPPEYPIYLPPEADRILSSILGTRPYTLRGQHKLSLYHNGQKTTENLFLKARQELKQIAELVIRHKKTQHL